MKENIVLSERKFIVNGLKEKEINSYIKKYFDFKIVKNFKNFRRGIIIVYCDKCIVWGRFKL